jgi:hypothetical protein
MTRSVAASLGVGLLAFAVELLWWRVGLTEEEMQNGVHGGVVLGVIPVVVYSLMISTPVAALAAFFTARRYYRAQMA